MGADLPTGITGWYGDGLQETLDLLAALEDARDALIGTDHLAEAAQPSIRSRSSALDEASTNREAVVVDEQPLRAAQAARRLGVTTKDLLRLVYERKIRYVKVDEIAHIPLYADEYRAKAS